MVKNKSVGRPRILNLQQIVQAAANMDIDNLTMKMVADRLGVGIATLYKYVANRDELQQLVIDQWLSNIHVPRRNGRVWRDYVQDFCRSLCNAMVSQPSVIRQLMSGGFGDETSRRLKTDFMTESSGKDVSQQVIEQVYLAVCQVAIGAAVTETELNAQVKKYENPALYSIHGSVVSIQNPVTETLHLLIDALLEKVGPEHS